jgi:hypothetical protein
VSVRKRRSVSLVAPGHAAGGQRTEEFSYALEDGSPVAADCRNDTGKGLPTACAGVRPGAAISIEEGFSCTMNFLFRGSDGSRYVGTAGHCIIDGENISGKQVWGAGSGREASDGAGKRIGETAYWGLKFGQLDFGLIRLDRNVQASPEMCEFGGPTRLYTGSDQTPATIDFFSDTSGPGKVLPGRTLLAATGFPGKYTVDAFGVALFGDSGAPAVLQDGRALGVLIGGGAGWSAPPAFSAGNVFLMRLDHQLKVAEKALGVDLTLLTAAQK